nr:SOS response-associated peptidase family protein [Caballeronia mineralivorans]
MPDRPGHLRHGAPQTHPAGREAFRHHECALESVGEKRSYSGAWQKLQFCLIPCRSFYEPSYETGSAVHWRIGLERGKPLATAGLGVRGPNPKAPRFRSR